MKALMKADTTAEDLRINVETWIDRLDAAARGVSNETVADIITGNALDTRFEIDGNGTMHDAKVLVSLGGPNVWIGCGVVRGYYGSEEYEGWTSTKATEEIIACFEAQYEAVKHLNTI